MRSTARSGRVTRSPVDGHDRVARARHHARRNFSRNRSGCRSWSENV